MSTFTVKGSRNGSLVHVTWTDGRISGDFPTVDLLLTEAELVPILHTDAYAARALPHLDGMAAAPLQDAAAAYRLIVHVMDSVRETTGDVPAAT
ncbi:hypothetical protein GCM10017691_40360 [Pseudonocardia petroleophila]|uniref:Uncharacterized protein n=1 Tax=Pseudonocardia petroleophila TaxID=37331 RepID=A0A7G7MBU3_9PSEU|nr:hypothetical protein [Pseudonocardia petroleophila]QNG50254.1 hypothetical protein H6H00_18585 [Pseudonocardia petroleophila]